MTVVTISGPALATLLSELERVPIWQLSVSHDGDDTSTVKIKLNEGMWTLPLMNGDAR